MSELKFNIDVPVPQKLPTTYTISFSESEIKEILEKHMKDNGLEIPNVNPRIWGLHREYDRFKGTYSIPKITLEYEVYE